MLCVPNKGGEENYMNILLWIIFGALVGWVGSIIMKTNTRQGLIMDIVLGIAGAFLGGFIVSFFGGRSVTGFDLYSFLVALLGAVVLIWIGRKVSL